MHLAKRNMHFTYENYASCEKKCFHVDKIYASCLHQNFIEIFILQYKKSSSCWLEICTFLVMKMDLIE